MVVYNDGNLILPVRFIRSRATMRGKGVTTNIIMLLLFKRDNVIYARVCIYTYIHNKYTR